VDFIILFLIGLGTGLSGAMIPGPLFLFTVSESLKKDAAVGLRVAFGHILVEAVFVAMIFYGLKAFITSPMFMSVVSGVGAVALFTMGVLLLNSSRRMSLDIHNGVEFDYGAVTGGAFFSIISPGFLIWWSTIGLSVILKSLLYGFLGFCMVAVGHWIADIGWHWFVSYFVNRGKSYLNDRSYRAIIRWLAVGLILAGAYFFISRPS